MAYLECNQQVKYCDDDKGHYVTGDEDDAHGECNVKVVRRPSGVTSDVLVTVHDERLLLVDKQPRNEQHTGDHPDNGQYELGFARRHARGSRVKHQQTPAATN